MKTERHRNRVTHHTRRLSPHQARTKQDRVQIPVGLDNELPGDARSLTDAPRCSRRNARSCAMREGIGDTDKAEAQKPGLRYGSKKCRDATSPSSGQMDQCSAVKLLSFFPTRSTLRSSAYVKYTSLTPFSLQRRFLRTSRSCVLRRAVSPPKRSTGL